MSVFTDCDERILIEEIVQTTEVQEAEISSTEGIDENNSDPTVTIVEVHVTEKYEQPQPEDYSDLEKNDEGDPIPIDTVYSRSVNRRNIPYSIVDDHNKVNLPRNHMEQEKRMRREIANSNERRRMQSINAGFQSLRTLLPHHEGEKLSKAAILQHTAEYIYQLEQEKTHLLSQNCQLKRLVNQHEGGDVPIKKRKVESQGVVVSLPMHVSESGDEGLGSTSPDPLSVIAVTTDNHTSVSVLNNSSNNSGINNEVTELKRQLERERNQRLQLEKQLLAIQTQLYPERYRDKQHVVAYQQHEVVEHMDNAITPESDETITALQVVSVMSIPAIGSTQTVETSNQDSIPSPLSPQEIELVTEEVVKSEDCQDRKIVAFSTNHQVFTAIRTEQEQGCSETFSSIPISYKNDFNNSNTQFIEASPTRSFSPPAEPPQRLPSVLEAAMKAEPKVEVERLPSPASSLEDGSSQTRLYLNTSRQNLETIVEAIRHLEGDHLFSDEPAQDVPLALTNKSTAGTLSSVSSKQRLLHTDVNNFLHFETQQQTQQRPGVIVVKHS